MRDRAAASAFRMQGRRQPAQASIRRGCEARGAFQLSGFRIRLAVASCLGLAGAVALVPGPFFNLNVWLAGALGGWPRLLHPGEVHHAAVLACLLVLGGCLHGWSERVPEAVGPAMALVTGLFADLVNGFPAGLIAAACLGAWGASRAARPLCAGLLMAGWLSYVPVAAVMSSVLFAGHVAVTGGVLNPVAVAVACVVSVLLYPLVSALVGAVHGLVRER